jgi:hypothetical protein
MFNSRNVFAALLRCLRSVGLALAQAKYPGIGRAATPKEVAAWDIDVRPDFKGLPPGKGSVAQGRTSGKPSAPPATACLANPTRCSPAGGRHHQGRREDRPRGHA